METVVSYEFHAYYKQGDDFGHILRNTKNVSEALREWAEGMTKAAEEMRSLAKLFEGKDITAQADTHMVMFEGDENVLEIAAKDSLLEKVELDAD